MLARAYYQSDIQEFLERSEDQILGELSRNSEQNLADTQRYAWTEQIRHLKEVLQEHQGHIAFEFVIPRIGKRADVVLLIDGIVYIVEYKVGANSYDRQSIDQAYDYVLDLKNFHAASHNLPIVPILVATNGRPDSIHPNWDQDGVASPACANKETLLEAIAAHKIAEQGPIDATDWLASRYKPTPTIVEAARALYAHHDVHEISHSEGSDNLGVTSEIIEGVIEDSKRNGCPGIHKAERGQRPPRLLRGSSDGSGP